MSERARLMRERRKQEILNDYLRSSEASHQLVESLFEESGYDETYGIARIASLVDDDNEDDDDDDDDDSDDYCSEDEEQEEEEEEEDCYDVNDKYEECLEYEVIGEASIQSRSANLSHTESKSSGSPRGVDELDKYAYAQPTEVIFERKKSKPRSVSQRFVDMFRCGPNTADDQFISYSETDFDVDDESVGDLTATSYERKIDRNLKKSYFTSRNDGRLDDTWRHSLPVAFGGNGLCSSAGPKSRVAARRSNLRRVRNKVTENYFSEYGSNYYSYSFGSSTQSSYYDA